MDTYSLKSVFDLPAPFRSCFSFRYFNSLQSECFPICFHSDANMVISAPTGSGKTVLFELCVLRLLSRFISADGRFIHSKGSLKTVYIAPSKALVQEKLREWNRKFGPWGINCLELTGDSESYTSRNIHEADIILTTPEKFDAVSRYGIEGGGLSFFSDIALLLIDEVHLLNDPRGAALEAIVSRIKIVSCNPKMKLNPLAQVRLVAVSATIPNIEDLAEWIKVPEQGIKRFGEEMRPVKLTTKVFGYAPAKNDFLFEKRLQNYIFGKEAYFSLLLNKFVLVRNLFSAVDISVQGAQEAAQRLSQIVMTFGQTNPFIRNREQQDRLREASLSCSDKQMQSYILYGGMPEMCGRAGRPPFDDTGLVIIMTRRETVNRATFACIFYCPPPLNPLRYHSGITVRQPLSKLKKDMMAMLILLLPCVTEHLLAEIVQLTVTDITKAIEWLQCSYLYVRMKKNPENYSIKKGISGDRLVKHVQDICVKKVNELSQHQMVEIDEDGFLLSPLDPGRLMTKYYLRFDTMKQIMRTPENCCLEDALHVICSAEEIAWIQLRRNEKKLLNEINADKDGRLRFHILGDRGKKKKRIQTREEKIFILANDCLTGDPSVHDLSLIQDMNSICSNGCRIAKCMKEYFIFKHNYKGAVNSALLAKSLDQKLWDDSPYLLKQLPGIGMVTAKALNSMGIKSFEALAEADPRRIEIVTGRKYPFGNHIKDSLLSLPPKVEIKLAETESNRQGKFKLVVTLTRISQTTQSVKRHYADMIVGLEEGNTILFHEKISPYCATILVPVTQGNQTIKADFVYEEYIGIDVHEKLHMVKAGISVVPSKRNKKQGFLPPPEEVYVIEDDNITIADIPMKKLSTLNKDKEEDNSIPSFKLLDEEIEEGGHALEVEDDDCKIITEKTVFDHIREKARNFSLLAALDNIRCPPLDVLTRNHAREKRPAISHDILVLDDADTAKVPQTNQTNFPADPSRLECNDANLKLTSNDQNSAGSSNDMNHIVETGVFLPDSEARTYAMPTEETVFDHILRKSNNFPQINKPDCLESVIWKTELFSKNHLNAALGIATERNPSDMVTDSILNSFMGSVEAEKYASGVQVDTEKKRLLDSAYFEEGGKKQHCSSGESKEVKSSLSEASQSCTLETACQMKEAESYLGFKSVFSFL
ncbi:uncharacterized protein DS421_16g554730 [Arachis hypogaea]|nr:uncharacterized protein DS421_16g554730 [Arachis hypogaea]